MKSLKGLLRNNRKDSTKKTVRFSKTVKVILIPTRMEYKESGLGNLLWWRCSDIEEFKDSARKEIDEIFRIEQPSISMRQAILQLF
jgi:hypothetical protein